MNNKNQELFQERLNRVEKAIRLEIPDRVPVATFFASWVQEAQGSCYRDIFYDHDKAGQAALDFYARHPLCDAHSFAGLISGRTHEMLQTSVLDWPGRPGTAVSDHSSHQIIERELMLQEEYEEMLDDFTGFMIRKYIPRLYPSLQAFSGVHLQMTSAIIPTYMRPFYNPEMLKCYEILGKVAEENNAAMNKTFYYMNELQKMGFPDLLTASSEAPYDILGDYYRGTMGIFEDLVNEDMQELMERACDLFADQQIESLQFLKYADIPVKRVFFPLHKGMDGFMNEEQYERLYWKPLKKVMMALIEMGITPFIYTEGKYNTRLEQLTDIPRGKVIYHFEDVDMKRAKRILGKVACITGNLPCSLLEFGKKEEVIDETKRLLDICMPDGGYMFDMNGNLEGAKEENVEAMFETLERYGKY